MAALPDELVAKIDALLDERVPHREIAKLLGTHRNNVSRHAKARMAQLHSVGNINPKKCPRCFRLMIRLPCQACKAEAAISKTLANQRAMNQHERSA